MALPFSMAAILRPILGAAGGCRAGEAGPTCVISLTLGLLTAGIGLIVGAAQAMH